jgi:hypothetical protein
VKRLDVVRMRGGVEPEVRFPDVPFDPRTGEALMLTSAAGLKS